ncbi:subclass B1 metallo-beta-lactamase [Flagellimonas taeanensis]|uniref:subclass B1 metallo-beta-lactamase n=1 Tax=Flavobacteriaceae TaxID=49546 RepID=UPI000E6880F2|nr:MULTISPECIES: subclass B1 metallo-beta-lactamase [Allomuricauda]MDC6385015.1 subclass B1 metallo-beta-lactamase [Muricauda sp. SK9]RIV49016.1 subclass B1 metallo-beta-lactamase [Allomuricauda taeanensis]
MKKRAFTLLIVLILFSCGKKEKQIALKTDTLEIVQLTEHIYVHISYLETDSFGKVACNGMIVVDDGEAIVMDTPVDNAVSKELMDWLETQHVSVRTVVATHFHDDCLGGLKTFHEKGIASYAHQRTIALLPEKEGERPQNGFTDLMEIHVGDKKVVLDFVDEGHTQDNIIAYFPHEDVMFGGCLVKSIGASKGFLGDANVAAWSQTVSRIKSKYPNTAMVVPGHGESGDSELLDYTIALFKE